MSATSPSTVETARELLRRNADLATWLADLGTRSKAAAAALAQAGTPPAGDLLDDLTEACREFGALSREILAAAAGARIAVPDVVASTRDLDILLRAMIDRLEAELRRAAAARARDETLALLDRVTALTHRDDPTFEPLAACQSQARELRATIAGSADARPGTWAPAIAPFAALLGLLEGQQALNDEAWATLEDTVVDAFGRPLAMAAARRKLQPNPRV